MDKFNIGIIGKCEKTEYKDTLVSISCALYKNIMNEEKKNMIYPDIFNEQNNPLIGNMIINKPTVHVIYTFIDDICKKIKLNQIVIIISLIYIHKAIQIANLGLSSTNWRPIIITSILITLKIWDDDAFYNSHMAKYLKHLDNLKIHINNYEITFLELIKYNVLIKPASYKNICYELYKLLYKILNDYDKDKKHEGEGEDLGGKHKIIDYYKDENMNDLYLYT